MPSPLKLLIQFERLGKSIEQIPKSVVQKLQEIEKDSIIRVLEQTNWRVDGAKGAALILDINPSTLRSRIRKLGIQKP